MLTQLHPLAAHASAELLPTWAEHLDRLKELGQFLESGGSGPLVTHPRPPVTRAQWVQFGRLLRDRRTAAGFSRVHLARQAKLSDATVKFCETARHPPSRATLIRLIGISELQLRWADVPGYYTMPAPDRGDEPKPVSERSELLSSLNSYLAPSYDPLALIADLARFLNGAGGYVEQTNAYLDNASAADYLAICHNSLSSSVLRSRLPLGEVPKHIAATIERRKVQVIALGAGDGTSEARLVDHMVEAGASDVELCLLDINQPLVCLAYRHAVEALAAHPNVQVCAVHGNFHHLPLYSALRRSAERRPVRRLFTMLGGTLGNLDHELRFLRQSLLDSEADDLLLLDVQGVSAPCRDPTQIRRRDRLLASGVPAQYAAWLGGPIWRHCKEVDEIDFHWNLETHCPVPGSYALHAVATVKSSHRADRQFSLFRFGRYDFTKLTDSLSEIGWEEHGAIPYGGEHSLRLYCKHAIRSMETQ